MADNVFGFDPQPDTGLESVPEGVSAAPAPRSLQRRAGEQGEARRERERGEERESGEESEIKGRAARKGGTDAFPSAAVRPHSRPLLLCTPRPPFARAPVRRTPLRSGGREGGRPAAERRGRKKSVCFSASAAFVCVSLSRLAGLCRCAARMPALAHTHRLCAVSAEG